MASGSLQPHCNREGFNNDVPGYTRVRLGIVANQENDCASPDSRLGLRGTGPHLRPIARQQHRGQLRLVRRGQR
jgi:hypothetical protein